MTLNSPSKPTEPPSSAPFGRNGVRFLLFLAAALFLHALVVGGWAWWNRLKPDAPLAGGGGSVEIIGLGGTSLASNRQAAPAPHETGRRPIPKPQSAPAGATVSSHGSGGTVGDGSGPGSGPAPGAGSGAAGDAALLARIRALLERHKRYPRHAQQMGIEGVPEVSFQINANGSVSAVRLVKSSGSPLLDEEALATIRRAVPFPFYAQPLHVAIRFRLNE